MGKGQQRLEHPSFRHRGSTESSVYDMCGQLGRPVAEQSHLQPWVQGEGVPCTGTACKVGRRASCLQGGYPRSLLSRTAVLLPPSERHNSAPMTSGGSLGSGRRLTWAQCNGQAGATWFFFFGSSPARNPQVLSPKPHFLLRFHPLPSQAPPPCQCYSSPKAPSRFWKIRQRWSRLILICSCGKEGLGCSRDRPQPRPGPQHTQHRDPVPHTGSACYILALFREPGNLKAGKKLRKQLVQP